MRKTSALARLAARLCGRKADALQEQLIDYVSAPNELDWRPGGYQFPRGSGSMRPRSYLGKSEYAPLRDRPMATTRSRPLTEGKMRGNRKPLYIDGRGQVHNPPPPTSKAPAAPVHKTPPANPPARCEYLGGGVVQCCRELDHLGGHLFKCAGDYCSGLPWIASNTPHPTSCTMPPGDE